MRQNFVSDFNLSTHRDLCHESARQREGVNTRSLEDDHNQQPSPPIQRISIV